MERHQKSVGCTPFIGSFLGYLHAVQTVVCIWLVSKCADAKKLLTKFKDTEGCNYLHNLRVLYKLQQFFRIPVLENIPLLGVDAGLFGIVAFCFYGWRAGRGVL
jgi:hypothetical protein